MRAYDLALILALFGAVMGLLDSSAVWSGGSIYNGPEVINQTSFDNIKVIENPSGIDIAIDMMSYGWTALLLLFTALLRIVFIADIIASIFGNTAEAVAVAVIIQFGIWLTYAIAMFQAKTGKSLKGME